MCASVTVCVRSDYECAQFVPSFFPSCSHIISIMMNAEQLAAYGTLAQTCKALPKEAMVGAISSVPRRAGSPMLDPAQPDPYHK